MQKGVYKVCEFHSITYTPSVTHNAFFITTDHTACNRTMTSDEGVPPDFHRDIFTLIGRHVRLEEQQGLTVKPYKCSPLADP